MEAVSYRFKSEYLYGGNRRYPGLTVRLEAPANSRSALEIPAALDSGAEYSLFQGDLAKAIGLDLLSGREFNFRLANGGRISARILSVKIGHPHLGIFAMNLRFSTADIEQNLLGRDFFNLMQVGFRERHSTILLEPSP